MIKTSDNFGIEVYEGGRWIQVMPFVATIAEAKELACKHTVAWRTAPRIFEMVTA